MLRIPSWFPFAGWKRYGEKWGDYHNTFVSEPFEQVLKDIVRSTILPKKLVVGSPADCEFFFCQAAGTAAPSFTSAMLESEKNSAEISDFTMMWLSGSMCACALAPPRITFHLFIPWSHHTVDEAGADTTHALIVHWFLAMVLHPEVQKKAQEELDSVVGPDRLPDLDE